MDNGARPDLIAGSRVRSGGDGEVKWRDEAMTKVVTRVRGLLVDGDGRRRAQGGGASSAMKATGLRRSSREKERSTT